MSPERISQILAENLSQPLPEPELADLPSRLSSLHLQLALLRSYPHLEEEEPSLPPSLEENP